MKIRIQRGITARPREGHDVHLKSSVLEIVPSHTMRWMRDVNGNSLAKVEFTAAARAGLRLIQSQNSVTQMSA
jgi:hypothetical protein